MLCPPLFNIFVNYLFYAIHIAHLSSYVENKQLFYGHTDTDVVQTVLDSEMVTAAI